ncbi:type IV pilin [Haloferax sp. S1W]|uniref:type IV pilin n=1 Tax=Haloferax sp. S1W TaxID=3377110 RepID=UPI0037C9A14D
MLRQLSSDTRGSTVLIGGVLLVGIVVIVAGVVGAAAFDVAESTPSPDHPTMLSLSVTGNVFTLTHEAGAPLHVSNIQLRVSIDGEELRHQPPVPFFSAAGFRPGPSGPFNTAADGTWTVGETAQFELAGTNAPTPTPGARVVVRVYEEETPVAVVRATVR